MKSIVALKFGLFMFLLCSLLPIQAQATTPDEQLKQAVRIGNIKAMKAAIKKGAKANQGNLLIDAASGFCDPRPEDEDTQETLKQQCPEVVRVLVEAGADVHQSLGGGMSALMAAAIEDYLDVVKYLISKGAVVDAKNGNGRTALIESANHGRSEVIPYLLTKGADVNAVDNGGFTALMRAAQGGHEQTVKVLLQAGANKSQKTTEQKTALSLAESALESYESDLKTSNLGDVQRKVYQDQAAKYQRTVALLKGGDLKSIGPMIGKVFSAEGSKLEITGERIGTAKKGTRLVIKTAGGEIIATVKETLHSKIKAVSAKSGAHKGDAVYLEK